VNVSIKLIVLIDLYWTIFIVYDYIKFKHRRHFMHVMTLLWRV